MKRILTLLVMLSALAASAQVRTYPLSENHEIVKFLKDHPSYSWNIDYKKKWGIKDTLSLPFFDDFTIPSIYPDSSKWLNNQVYVNNTFGWEPPSRGVATFDVLNASGVPYKNTINKDFYSAGDTLTSQLINLKDSAGVPYTLSDSIHLSFYIQANGYGYHLSPSDSIRLFFKSKQNNWVRVWTIGGISQTTAFTQVIIPIRDTSFLHTGFQFMFTTLTRQVGNANHWNLDYVYLNKDRSARENSYPDYAIQTAPSSMLKQYAEMPFSHFMEDPAAEAADSSNFYVVNLDSTLKVMDVKHTDVFNGTVLRSTNFATNERNLPARSNDRRRLDSYNFYSSLSGPLPVLIRRKVEMQNAGQVNANTDNDSIISYQRFYDYFAYDDGSAEQGFGFDQETNPSNLEGEIAYKFKLNKRDTLFAIGTFFNRAVYDVSRELFTFRVWTHIAEPGGSGTDSLIYESDPMNPQYMSRINEYSIHYIDTLLILPKGEFYIGWYQSRMFNLNVGWDKNFGGKSEPNVTSDKLFYKIFGNWSNADLPEGTLMMRPFVGSSRTVTASVTKPLTIDHKLNYHPNPARDHIQFDEEMEKVDIYSMEGVLLMTSFKVKRMNLSDLPNGVYVIRASNSSNQSLHSKLFIFAP